MSLPSGKQGGFSFSLGLKNTEKKGMISMNIFGKQEDDTKEKKIFLTEVVDNELMEDASKKKELVIPLKKPSWIAKAKERIEREKEEKNAAKSPDAKDEARIAILKDIYHTNDPSEAESNLVIPLHKREGETESADGKKAPLINRNRIPGAESMSHDEYFKRMMDALPEECDVHGDAYEHIKIEDFGKAVLRGMGWDGKNNVDPSVYEIKPRPERLGLGAMPLVVDKKVRNDAVKTTAAERAARRGYSGVKNEWGDAHSLRIGVQVGVVSGPLKGRQGAVVETPSSTSTHLKVLLDGEKQVRDFDRSDLMMLNDLTRVQSFINTYGRTQPVAPILPQQQPPSPNHHSSSRRERSRSRDHSASRRRDDSNGSSRRRDDSHSHRHHHHHTHSSHWH
ncbi:hypothetical protein WA577_007079 [Blastocystis sp. JDR]